MVGALAVDDQGRVLVGSVDQVGWLEPKPHGGFAYQSLREQLGAGAPPIGFVTAAHALPAGGFAFLTESALWVWTGADAVESTVAKVADFAPGPLPKAFLVGAELWLWEDRGLFRLAGTRLEQLPDGDRCAGRPIAAVLPWRDGSTLVAVADAGLVLWHPGGEQPFDAAATTWAKRAVITSALRLADGRVALGSERAGLLLLGASGAVERALDSANGLPADHVRGMLQDREQGLWLALDPGLVRLEMAAPVSVFDSRVGLRGTPLAFARASGQLWVGTTSGLFRLLQDPGFGGTVAIPVDDFSAAVFALLPRGEELLVGTRGGLYSWSQDRVRLVPGSRGQTVYCLAASVEDPSVLWVGTRAGLGRAQRVDDEGWRFDGIAAGSPRVVRSIFERGRRLWLGTAFDGVVRADLPAAGFRAGGMTFSAGTGEGENQLYELQGRIAVATENQVRVLDEATGVLGFDPKFAALQGHGMAFVIREDGRGNVWLNSDPPVAILRRPDGSYDPRPRFAAGVVSKDNQGLFVDTDGSVWIGGERGLVHFAGDVAANTTLPAPILHRATVGAEVVDLAADAAAPELAAYGRRLRIEVGPCSYRGALRYQYRLDPEEPEWSRERGEAFVEFTNLPPGEFSLHVRSLGPGGEVSPETLWAFAVRPPWYRTRLAWVAWLVLLGLAAVAVVQGYTRQLRRKAAVLEAQVAAKTHELSRAADELLATQAEFERKHVLLEAAHTQLADLSNRDELTGIANRRCLFEALAGEWARAARAATPLSFVLFDLDHFKSLNDRLGHQEGDRSLRRVGVVLASEVGRKGDLAARYGGEEFAVLLPGTDLDGAALLAERIREAIAALVIEIPESPVGVLTASFGVVCRTPEIGESEDAFIQAADRALYAAKAAGRNRVVRGA
jgi:diguanylate cyclase (GGDEF)-like protein